jgi:hypothetical protein
MANGAESGGDTPKDPDGFVVGGSEAGAFMKNPSDADQRRKESEEAQRLEEQRMRDQEDLRGRAAQPSNLTIVGMRGAIALAGVSLVGALGLCLKLVFTGINSHDVLLVRVLLSCVAVFVATGFGALGFGLFLIKAEGALKASIKTGETPSTLETTAPGLAVFVCATIIMYLALHMSFSKGGEDTDATTGPSEKSKPTANGAPQDAHMPDDAPSEPIGGEMKR